MQQLATQYTSAQKKKNYRHNNIYFFKEEYSVLLYGK